MPPPRQPVSEVIKSLSNQELVRQLQEYGVTTGPVLPSTRRVYERKLFELQTGERLPPSTNYAPVDDDEEDDSPDEEVVIQRAQPRLRTTHTTRTETRASASRGKAKEKKPSTDSKGGLPSWAIILTVLVIAVFIFLVIKNLEPEPATDIPDQIEERV